MHVANTVQSFLVPVTVSARENVDITLVQWSKPGH